MNSAVPSPIQKDPARLRPLCPPSRLAPVPETWLQELFFAHPGVARAGRGRAGRLPGGVGRPGDPRRARRGRTARASVTTAMTRQRPPHWGYARTSDPCPRITTARASRSNPADVEREPGQSPRTAYHS
jgi:hypothetical protein